MPNAATYYNTILEVLDDCALYQMHFFLYDDLTNGDPPSPDSYRTLVKHHDSDLNVLYDKLCRAKKKRQLAGRSLVTMMNGMGIYVQEDAVVWCVMIMRRQEDCDFRKKCRDWCRSELAKIEKNGKDPEQVMAFADFIERYEKLVAKRRAKRHSSRMTTPE